MAYSEILQNFNNMNSIQGILVRAYLNYVCEVWENTFGVKMLVQFEEKNIIKYQVPKWDVC